ncbi:MAG: T9SS type A sorting domain-containing protein, partial [bacterium]
STCRAVGEYCYVFVQDSQWVEGGNGRVTQAAVDSITKYFDSYTPNDPDKGIYETDVQNFGTPPDFDGDTKIIILILDIQDSFEPGSGWVAGYFFSVNQYADRTFPGRRSNEAEIYYIDSDPTDLNDANGLRGAMSTTAHEFQHMIHWGKDKDELTFINEGCATAAEVICGFSIYNQIYFNSCPNRYLLEWAGSSDEDVFKDYSRSARWTVYLHEQFPNDYLYKMVAENENGIDGINKALKSYTPATSRRFINIFEDWCVANYLNDKSLDDVFGYDYFPMSAVIPKRTFIDPNVSSIQDTVKNLAAQYIRFTGGSDLSITFNTQATDLAVKAIKIGSTIVDDVPLNTEYTVPDYGTTYPEVTFVVINKDESAPAIYTYSASGTEPQKAQKVAYDDGEPEGYLTLSIGDTIAVIFEGLTGTTFDSLRVAFRRAGSITMGINKVSSYGSSFIGEELLSPMTVQCFSESPYPYPEPYENWIYVDLTSYNIDASNEFVVWFEVTDPDAPAVMISVEPDDGDYHSYTYSHDHGNKWLRFVDGEGNVYNYLVQAYLGLSSAIDDELLTSNIPDEYSLSQNYPNPFNPLTTIQYALPKPGKVSVMIYDITGREIMELINEEKSAGYHSVEFDGSRLSSGLYFYRLKSNNFQQIRKMMIIK